MKKFAVRDNKLLSLPVSSTWQSLLFIVLVTNSVPTSNAQSVRQAKVFPPGERGAYTAVAYSRDGKSYVAAKTFAGRRSELVVRDAINHNVAGRVVFDVPSRVYAISFTTHGDAVVCAGNGGVATWRLDANTIISHSDKTITEKRRLSISPNGSSYLNGNRVFSIPGGELLFEVDADIRDVSFSNDGGQLVAVAPLDAKNDTVKILDSASGLLSHEMRVSSRSRAVSFSADGSGIVTISSSGRPVRYDARFGVWDWSGAGDDQGFQQRLASSLDDHKIVSLATDNVIRIWDAANGVVLPSVRIEERNVVSLAAGSTQFATVNAKGSLRIWDMSQLKTETQIERERIREEIASVSGNRTAAIQWLNNKRLRELYTKCSPMKIQISTPSYSRSPVTDDWLDILVNFPELRELTIHNAKITDHGLRKLWSAGKLEELSLYGARISDEGMIRLALLKQLRSLDLSGSKITDSALAKLATQMSLQEINLAGTNVTDVGLRDLNRFNLKGLVLSSTRVTDKGLERISSQTSLESLFLGGTRITDACVIEIAKLPNLKRLSISGTALTDLSLSSIGELTKLTSLHADSTTLSFNHPAAGNLKELKYLNLESSAVTDEGLKHIGRLDNLETLILIGTSISDEGLKNLSGLKRLKKLYLRATKVTPAGMGKLQRALPTCDVNQRWLG